MYFQTPGHAPPFPVPLMTQPISAGHIEVRDNDAHRYHIPEAQEAAFRRALDRICAATRQSSEWHDANAALDSEFGRYMIG